jgi:hypothetical protein
MSTEYLKAARKNGAVSDSRSSEASLIQNNEGLADAFKTLNDLRATIIAQKTKAVEEVDEQFADALAVAESQYAVMLAMSR